MKDFKDTLPKSMSSTTSSMNISFSMGMKDLIHEKIRKKKEMLKMIKVIEQTKIGLMSLIED